MAFSAAENSVKFSATQEADLVLIGIGTGRYEIPLAVVLGG
ncbi:MAG: hypothetical protein R3F41_16240 [Gammaproteobacteria bacterium]